MAFFRIFLHPIVLAVCAWSVLGIILNVLLVDGATTFVWNLTPEELERATLESTVFGFVWMGAGYLAAQAYIKWVYTPRLRKALEEQGRAESL